MHDVLERAEIIHAAAATASSSLCLQTNVNLLNVYAQNTERPVVRLQSTQEDEYCYTSKVSANPLVIAWSSAAAAELADFLPKPQMSTTFFERTRYINIMLAGRCRCMGQTHYRQK